MRVLLAEDETVIRLDLRELLERAGFEVCAEARDGAEAVDLARSERPDAAILDVKMPQLDGIEAAGRIYAERPIPIVMLTAYGQDQLQGDRSGKGHPDGEGRPDRAGGVRPAAPGQPRLGTHDAADRGGGHPDVRAVT